MFSVEIAVYSLILHFYLILWTHITLIFEYINVDIAYKSLNLKSNILAHLKSLSTDYFFLKYRPHIALCLISDFWLEIRHDRWYIAVILILYFSKDLIFWFSKQLTCLDSNCKPYLSCGIQQAMFLPCSSGFHHCFISVAPWILHCVYIVWQSVKDGQGWAHPCGFLLS